MPHVLQRHAHRAYTRAYTDSPLSRTQPRPYGGPSGASRSHGEGIGSRRTGDVPQLHTQTSTTATLCTSIFIHMYVVRSITFVGQTINTLHTPSAHPHGQTKQYRNAETSAPLPQARHCHASFLFKAATKQAYRSRRSDTSRSSAG